MAFAKSFRMPTIYNAIRGAKRVGDIARFGMPCSVRRAFDKLDRFPRITAADHYGSTFNDSWLVGFVILLGLTVALSALSALVLWRQRE